MIETLKSSWKAIREQPVGDREGANLSVQNWQPLAELLAQLPGTVRLCGAEINSITDRCPYVHQCRTHHWNSHLSTASRFRLHGEQIEGIFSNGSWTVKFYVDTSANTPGQRAAGIADLNQRLKDWI